MSLHVASGGVEGGGACLSRLPLDPPLKSGMGVLAVTLLQDHKGPVQTMTPKLLLRVGSRGGVMGVITPLLT